jgi:hypothetical protein
MEHILHTTTVPFTLRARNYVVDLSPGDRVEFVVLPEHVAVLKRELRDLANFVSPFVESEVSDGQWQVGHRGNQVVLQFLGNDAHLKQTGRGEVPPAFFCWTPDQAREVARLLIVAADKMEQG